MAPVVCPAGLDPLVFSISVALHGRRLVAPVAITMATSPPGGPRGAGEVRSFL